MTFDSASSRQALPDQIQSTTVAEAAREAMNAANWQFAKAEALLIERIKTDPILIDEAITMACKTALQSVLALGRRRVTSEAKGTSRHAPPAPVPSGKAAPGAATDDEQQPIPKARRARPNLFAVDLLAKYFIDGDNIRDVTAEGLRRSIASLKGKGETLKKEVIFREKLLALIKPDRKTLGKSACDSDILEVIRRYKPQS